MTDVMQNGSAPKACSSRDERREATRRRIVEAAGRLFRLHGIDGVGVDAVMREAGLTHGGFYVHFPSKEALAAEVCVAGLSDCAARWGQAAAEPEAVRALVSAYLAPERIGDRGQGCVLPTLGGELARRPEAHRDLGASIATMAEALARLRGPGNGTEPESLADLSCMVGAVVLARLAEDRALASRLLEAARTRVLGDTPAPEG